MINSMKILTGVCAAIFLFLGLIAIDGYVHEGARICAGLLIAICWFFMALGVWGDPDEVDDTKECDHNFELREIGYKGAIVTHCSKCGKVKQYENEG